MRKLILIALGVAFFQTAQARDDYGTAVVVDAGQGSELQAGGLWGIRNSNENMIAVELDGMRITATYETMFASGRRAASNFLVGSEVQARVHKNKWLFIVRDDGQEIKARITRREMAD